jgi:hypothetical protein
MRASSGRIHTRDEQETRQAYTMSGARTVGRVFFLALLVPGLCAADLPGLRAPLLNDPGTLAQFRAHLPGSGTTGPSVNDAEIQELARGLKYDPGIIYKFVRNHIHFTPVWGELKGPYMTWMDRSGGPFDQASLLVALLTQANGHGHTITDIKYVVGEICPTVAQFCGWFNLPAWDPNTTTARRILARGGFYGSITDDGYGEIDAITLVHVWVKATIDGQTYQFDPSY